MKPKSDPITRTVASNLCTGCGVCSGLFPEFIKMVDDEINGRRPVVDQSEEGHAAARMALGACAGVGADHDDLPVADQVDRDWGPVLKAWEGWARDEEIRYRGSSGGAVTGIAASLLANGVAERVLHVAQRAVDPRLNEAVISRDRAELMRGVGSRYAPAAPGEKLADAALEPGQFAFIGKPCDVASVARMGKVDPHLTEKCAATISIFCAGAPNIAATNRLLDRLSVPKDAIVTDLRYRGQGWPGMMQATYRDAEGAEHQSDAVSYGEGWGRVLQAGRKWRCRICADHTGEFADISVGDPWDTPPKCNMDAGRSLIVARTQRGIEIVEEAIRSGHLIARETARDRIAKAQPNLLDTRGSVFGRRLAMRLVGLPVPQDRGMNSFALWRSHLSLKRKAQSVAGSLKRILKARLWRPVRITPYEAGQ